MASPFGDIESNQPRMQRMDSNGATPFEPFFDEPDSIRKGSGTSGTERWGSRDEGAESVKKTKAPFPKAFIDTFRRAPMSRYTEPEMQLEDDADWDQIHHQLKASHYTTNTGLARKLKGRHLQMIAIGGSIGE